MDGITDSFVPYVESRALAAALEGRYARHSTFSVFDHVDLNRFAKPVSSGLDLLSLYLHINDLFQSILASPSATKGASQ